MADYKQFTENAKRGIRGEAFFESLLCEHAITHQVTGPKDVGIDYFCEWTHGDRPTGVLFAVQVKTTTEAEPELLATDPDDDLNGLERYRLRRRDPVKDINEATRDYWRGLSLPVYLFVIVDRNKQLDCYYRRMTRELTKGGIDDGKGSGYFKVNEDASFRAFASEQRGGFARDLFIDYVRVAYSRGHIVPLDAARLGLAGFPKNAVFADVLPEYKDTIIRTFRTAQSVLADLRLLE